MEDNLPFKFQLGDPVMVDLQLAGVIKNAKIFRIIRSQYKTYYDIEVLVYLENNEIETTLLKEVDEFFIQKTLN